MSVFAGRYAGRCAIVTGGASGLGKQVAARIIAEGGAVALWDLNGDALAATQAEIGAAHVQALDVSDHAAVSRDHWRIIDKGVFDVLFDRGEILNAVNQITR